MACKQVNDSEISPYSRNIYKGTMIKKWSCLLIIGMFCCSATYADQLSGLSALVPLGFSLFSVICLCIDIVFFILASSSKVFAVIVATGGAIATIVLNIELLRELQSPQPSMGTEGFDWWLLIAKCLAAICIAFGCGIIYRAFAKRRKSSKS